MYTIITTTGLSHTTTSNDPNELLNKLVELGVDLGHVLPGEVVAYAMDGGWPYEGDGVYLLVVRHN